MSRGTRDIFYLLIPIYIGNSVILILQFLLPALIVLPEVLANGQTNGRRDAAT